MEAITDVASGIRRSREALGLSQEQFARRLGVSFATVNRWEGERSVPRRAAMEKLVAIRALAVGQPGPDPLAAGAANARIQGLPAFLTTFIGRREERHKVETALRQGRLVTIAGPAGSGKTRLAVEVVRSSHLPAIAVADFATLEAVQGDDDVVGALAAQLAVTADEGAVEAALIKRLADVDLLVIDACEPVVSGCRRIVTTLLPACPSLRVLTTGRVPLDIAAETVVRLGPMAAGDTATSDAVALFLDRVRRQDETHRPSASELAAIAAVCDRLDRLPLAIELAASWVPTLAPEAILSRLHDRVTLHAPRRSRAAGPQGMVDATTAWSYDLLSPAEQRLLEQLSVFPVTFTLEAAEAVARVDEDGPTAVVLLGLASLVARSLVDVRPGQAGRRFALLETVRQFGRERLAERGASEAASARLYDWSLAFARRAARGLAGPDQQRWMTTVALEADTVELALSWAIERRDATRAVTLAGTFWRYWYARSSIERGLRSLTSVLALGASDPSAERAAALLGAGVLARQRGRFGEAVRFLRDYLAVCQERGDEPGIAAAYSSLAGALHGAGETGRAREMLIASVDAWERLRDRRGMASALSNLGVLASDTGDYPAAREYGEQALALRLTLGHDESIAISYENLATAALRAGDTADAARLFREALRRYAALDEPDGVAASLDGLAGILPAPTAVRVAAAASRIRREIDVPRWTADEAFHVLRMADLRTSLGDAGFETGWTAGSALTSEAAIGLALAAAPLEDGGPPSRGLHRRLSPREREVLGLVVEGHASKEMAARLGLSPRTVERHLANIYAKVGARGRADAIAFGLRMAAADR